MGGIHEDHLEVQRDRETLTVTIEDRPAVGGKVDDSLPLVRCQRLVRGASTIWTITRRAAIATNNNEKMTKTPTSRPWPGSGRPSLCFWGAAGVCERAVSGPPGDALASD